MKFVKYFVLTAALVGGFSSAVDDPNVILRRLYASDGDSNFTGFSTIDFDNILAAQAKTNDVPCVGFHCRINEDDVARKEKERTGGES